MTPGGVAGPRRVAVVGGGLAGLTAALRLADAGAAVTLHEAKPRLGGLTSSFRRGELWVDNGQHVFLRCCTSYRAFLDRLGVTELTTLQDRLDIPVRSDTAEARLRRGRMPAPLHLAASLARYPWLTTLDRARFVRAALALRAVDRDDPRTDDLSFGRWLRSRGQDPAAVGSLWDLVGVATLNVRADDASLALAATVFQIGMLTDRAGGDIGWARVPLQQLHGDAAGSALADAGADVHTRSKVRALHPVGSGWTVVTDDGREDVDDVVVAAPPAVTESLVPHGALDVPAGWSRELGVSPIVNLHVVTDRRVLDTPFVATAGSDVQWVFDRTDQSSLTSGQYLAVSVSAADEFVDAPTAALRTHFAPQLQAVLPRLRDAHVHEFFVTREREATFRAAPGTARLRPGNRTRAPGLYVAGAWTATGWPATMESAVRSGDAAADALLEDARDSDTREAA
ncbi:hydroxysqualene dehydroxylase HpnE [Rhodococcus sp. HNM0569]|uniref:hydroxysqualene dehydroxylase HpnE n=1 Tax=Rhodococcus sp. HNM0569 TaxID=2716340 RepID=UPI00146B6B88|nr:FAD-dependent oxidoreductase [Rhodococcus sp. HNM0569]